MEVEVPTGDLGGTHPGTFGAAEAREMYDRWGDKYTESIEQWGYKTPEQIAKMVKDHCTKSDAPVLDLGAGDGLSGLALKAAGFSGDMTALDISPKLLEIARARGVYEHVMEADLSIALPLESHHFGVVVCVGTLTYLKPTCGLVDEMVRVCQPGGVVGLNLRTDHIDAWTSTFERLEKVGKWKLIERRGPVAYLPDHPDYTDKVQTVLFAFRVGKDSP